MEQGIQNGSLVHGIPEHSISSPELINIYNVKYIDLFEAYSKSSEPSRTRTTPKNWIVLNSIGYILNPENGFAYPVAKDGSTYYLDELFDSQGDGGFGGFHSLSEEDQKIVDQYYKSTESLVKNHINFDLIDTIKDASLDYVDNGMWLMFHVGAYNKFYTTDTLQVYYEYFSKDKTYKEWSKYYKHDMDLINVDKLKYSMTITIGNSEDQYPYKRVQKADDVLEFVKKMSLENGWNDIIVRK